jgi:chromosomal replication initiation ATPase DnaA
MNAKQLALELPSRIALNRTDFLVTPSNSTAVAAIDAWPNWPAHGVVIVGPAGSGKTHLAHVFQQVTGATRIESGALTSEKIPELLSHDALIVEHTESQPLDETALFHALNVVRQEKQHILLTSRNAPSSWHLALPDLRSRLAALPIVVLAAPDDELLAGVILKLFDDRQLVPAENVLPYLLQRMPRSLEAVQLLVTEIDRRALAERANISRPFVSRVLEELLQSNRIGLGSEPELS